jgi:hypothetical protein
LKTLLFILITFLTSCFEKSIEEQLKARDLNNNMVVDEVEEYINKSYPNNDVTSRNIRKLYFARSKNFYKILIHKNMKKEEARSYSDVYRHIIMCLAFIKKEKPESFSSKGITNEYKHITKLTLNNKQLFLKNVEYNRLLHGKVSTYGVSDVEDCKNALGNEYEYE